MKVLVLGGAHAGLCAATRLAEEGHDVTVVEPRESLGGGADALGPQLYGSGWSAPRRFLERVGTSDRVPSTGGIALRVVDREEKRPRARSLDGGARSATQPHRMDRVRALAGFGGLSLVDRGLALRVALALGLPSRLAPAARDGESASDWLRALSQGERARRALWEPLARVLVGDDPRLTPAPLLATVLRPLVVGDAREASLAQASSAPRDLWIDPARRQLARHHATVREGVAIERVRVKPLRDRMILDGVALAGGEVLHANAVIAALPPEALLPLLDEELRHREPYFVQLARQATTPHIHVALTLARPLDGGTPLLVAGSPFHVLAQSGDRAWLRALGAPDLARRSDDAIADLARAELAALAPTVGEARVLAVAIERRLVTSQPDLERPKPRTPVEGLFLAGDHVRSGWPAGLVASARSAEDAAGLALEFEPPPPPPPPQGFIPVARLSRRGPAAG